MENLKLNTSNSAWNVYIDEDMFYSFETKDQAYDFASIVINQGKDCFVKFEEIQDLPINS